MSESSDRIREALSRSSPGRHPATRKSVEEVKPEASPIAEAESEDVETTLPLISASDASRAGLSSPEAQTATMPLLSTAGEKTQTRRPVLLALCVLVALAGVSAFLLRDRWLPALLPAHSAVSFPLQVQVEPQANGSINIRWNPQSAAVTQGREGRLVITERDRPSRIVELSVEQLKIGHVYFQPSEDRIEIQLEVFDHSGAVTATESVLALASGLPVQRPAETPAEVSQESNATAVAEPEKVAEAPETQPSRPPVRTFTMPPPKPRSGEEGRVILPEMPAAPLSGSGNAPDLDLPAGVNGLSGAGRIAAPAVQAPPQAKEPPAKQPLKVGGNVQAANLIKKVTPIYPQLAQVARTQGTVRFTALIGKDGRIRNLELVSGPPALVPAAGDAVKQWVYRPTLLNGEPVEVITQIDVTFTLNR